MTLSVSDVQQVRFHLARRNGYDVTEVDHFIEQVQATIQSLTGQINELKRTGWEAADRAPQPLAAMAAAPAAGSASQSREAMETSGSYPLIVDSEW